MKIKIIALVLAVGAMLSGCAAVDAVADLFSPMPAYTTAPAEVKGEQYYYYNQLTEPEQMLYACLLAEAEKGADRCIMAKTDYDTVSECMARTVDAFLRDMPELYMFNGGATSSGEGGLGKNRDVTTVRLWKNEAFAGTEAEADAFRQKLAMLTDMAGAGADDFEKAVIVHDYLVSHTEYDEEAAASLDAEKTPDNASFTAYGCLVNGKAVCSGYAKAFQAVMLRLGIPCTYCVGRADGEIHAWNAVKLNGKWCHVDVTWDDPSYEEDVPWADIPGHNYFGLDDSRLPHLPENRFTYPECSGTENNYNMRTGIYMEEYAFSRAAQAINKQSGPVYTLAFGSPEALDAAFADLIDNSAWCRISKLKGRSIQYNRDDDIFTLSLIK